MLLSVPVAAVCVHEAPTADAHHHHVRHAMPASTPTATTTTSSGNAPSSSASQHPVPNNPARRVLRALLAVTRQPGGGRRPKQQQQQQRAVVAASAAAMPSAASPASAPLVDSPAPREHLLHSAASLPPPSPPRHPTHHRRRRDEPAAAGSAADASVAGGQQQQPQQQHPRPRATTSGGSINTLLTNPLRALLRLFLHHSHRAARAARPQGPGCNDATPLERAVNVLTSLPFLAVGAHVLRTRRAPAARRFGRSFVAVGVVAGAYHACPRGHPLRKPLRKADYWTIAWSSSLLREAVVGAKLPRWAALAACAITPAKPTAVTAANLAAIELAYARAAWACPTGKMRDAWRRHVGAAGVGLACFLAEDAVVASGKVPFNAFHGVWHILSAAALGLANALLGHVEQALLLEAAEVVADGEI